MIRPEDLKITKEEFDKIILDAEAEFMKTRAQHDAKNRERYVQFWVNLSPVNVQMEWIDELENSYKNAGWQHVEVKFVHDRTIALMIFLVP